MSTIFGSKTQILKQTDNKYFWLVQNNTLWNSEFNQFLRLRKKLDIEVENFGRTEILSPSQKPTMSKYVDEQLKLAHNVVDVVDCPIRHICLTKLWYNGDTPKNSMLKSN